ncbi:MAG: methyltransferase domain-containing protein [Bacilli bacterium]
MLVKAEKTAITNGVSKTAKLINKEISKDKRILDYGCGKLRNSIYLLDNEFKVSICDTKDQLINLNNNDKYEKQLAKFEDVFCCDGQVVTTDKYDIILNSFVLNVVDENTRRQILSNIRLMLKDDGYLYIEVRTYKDIENAKFKTPFQDGFLMGKQSIRTFQKPFYIDELENFLLINGFNVQYTKDTGKSIIAIATKEKSMYKCECCESDLIWQSDFDYEDYLIDNKEGIVAVYYCPHCDLLYEIFINMDNEVEEIWVNPMNDDEE